MGKGQDGQCAISLRVLQGGKRDPEQILAGIRSLELPGSFLVGGCVRDMVLGQEPHDWDVIACGVSEGELLGELGKHGQADALMVAEQLIGARFYADWTPADGIEIALPRYEKSTGPGHLDFQIQPISLPAEVARLPVQDRIGDWLQIIQQDAMRRDFTCNTLLHDIYSGEILDPTGQGLEDIKNKILRTVAPDSFRDDPLRILRGLARVSKDGMSFDPQTEQQAREWISKANHTSGDLSAERVQGELQKILSGQNSAQAFRLLKDWQGIDGVLPGWGACVDYDQRSKYHDLALDQHILKALEYADWMDYSPTVKMAVLLHDIGKPPTAKQGRDGYMHYYQADAKDPLWQTDPGRARSHEAAGEDISRRILNDLRYPAEEVGRISYLVRHHMFSEEHSFTDRPRAKQELLARRMLYKHGLEKSEQLLELRSCDLNGKTHGVKPGWNLDLEALLGRIEQQKHQPYRISDLAIDGRQIIQLGVQPGPRVGEILQDLLKQVVGQPEANHPERLLKIAKRLAQASAE